MKNKLCNYTIGLFLGAGTVIVMLSNDTQARRYAVAWIIVSSICILMDVLVGE